MRFRDAWNEKADHLNAPPLRSAVESVQRGLLVPCSELRAILKRNPEIGGRGRLDAIEALSGHADHGEWNAFYVNGLADGGGTAAEARGPVGIAENEDAGVRGLVFGREPAAVGKGNGVLFAKRFKHRVGERPVAVTGAAHAVGRRIGEAQEYELLRVGQRKVTKQNGVHDAEDRGVSTDAKSEGEHRDEREAGAFAQHAGGEAHILPTRVHKGFPAARTDHFLRSVDAATLQAHFAKGGHAAHPLLDLFFSCHLLVGAKLLIQLPVDLFLYEQGAKPACKIWEQGHYEASRILPIAATCLPHSRVSLLSLLRPFAVRV